MFYRLFLLMNFTEEDPINDILDKVADHLESAITINQGADNAEPSHYQLQKCYHDEHPGRDCEIIEVWALPH